MNVLISTLIQVLNIKQTILYKCLIIRFPICLDTTFFGLKSNE